ncbi:MAG TPA: MFS transporter [Vicinamibacteria bacterium]|nr:MFS transporter [Vicinamibacteria bacterium]
MDKPRLRFWQIWNMSFGFLGIQFGWGLQMANMSAIYQYLGAREDEIPILWLAAPLTGLVVQPIIGYFSDRTWNRLGRRRPYFLGGAIAASLALLAMPNSSALWMAAGLLWILDASVNISMEPFRAFVGDMLPHEQRKSGFAMQSLLIGAGAVLSSALPYVLTRGFGVSGESTVGSAIPPTVHVAFTIGSFVFFLAVLYTVVSTPEYPPEDLAAFERAKRETSGLGHAFREIFQGIGSMPGPMRKLAAVQFFTWFSLFCLWIYFAPGVAKRVFGGAPLGVANATVERTLDDPQNAPLLDGAAAVARGYEELKARVAGAAPASGEAGRGAREGLLTMLGLRAAPPDPGSKVTAAEIARLIERSLASAAAPASEAERRNPLVRTAASLLGKNGLAPGRAAETVALGAAAGALVDRLASARRYQEGVSWAGVCFAAYNLVAFGFSFLLLALVRRSSARSIHIACLALGALGLLSVLVVREPHLLLLSMVGVGVAWASILAMPYAMLSNALPPAKMGFYMGVFNFFIVLPQILASVGLGFVMERWLGNDATKALLLGGASMVLASLLTLRVREEETE